MVFGRETVDPEADPRNTLYGSDAATPTFPGDIYTEGGSIDLKDVEPLTDDIYAGLKKTWASRKADKDFVMNTIYSAPYRDKHNIPSTDYLADMMTTMVEDDLYDKTGKEMTKPELEYWNKKFKEIIETHQPQQMLPAKYFKDN